MAGVADEEDVATRRDETLRLPMNLGDQRAGRVEIGEAATGGS
eukprot:gene44654-60473_t